MPLMVMSPSMMEMDSPSRKRSHEEYSEDVAVKAEAQVDIKMEPSEMGTSIPAHLTTTSILSSPAQSSPAALTDAGASTPANGPASPSTPSRKPLQSVAQPAQNTSPAAAQSCTTTPGTMTLPTGQGPPKKQKKQKVLTPEEQAAKDQAEAAKREKNEKAKLAKEQKRVEKEKKKEEADRKKEEAERKARAQPKIANFFAKKEGAAPKIEKPAIVDEAAKARSASPLAQRTDYDKLAIPFFIHQSVKLAQSKFMIDDEAREAKTQILTDFLAGKRSPVKPNLGLVAAPVARGKSYPRVKDLMAEQEGGLSNSVNLTADSLSLPNRKLLKSIPVKQFSFHEDVRPGYYGTVTSVHSVPTLKKMAKKPTAKDLPLNYDYDSEAEWVQGDEEEDAEGLDDMSDDEEEEDDDKSIDEFLDDSDDIRRGPLMTAGSMEPESSGICFEDHTHRNPNSEMHKFRMDFLIPNLEHHHSIDPFSKAYWPSEIKTPASTTHTVDNAVNGIMRPPPAPKQNGGAATAAAASNKPEPGDLISDEYLADFKATILEFKFLPKSALIPTLKKKFERCTSNQIKATLDHVAEKPQKRGDWKLKESA